MELESIRTGQKCDGGARKSLLHSVAYQIEMKFHFRTGPVRSYNHNVHKCGKKAHY